MTKENAHLYLPHVEALRDGELQWQNPTTGKWHDIGCTCFEYAPDCYRRKPKPREWWVNEYQGLNPEVFSTKEDAERRYNMGRTIRVREVIE